MNKYIIFLVLARFMLNRSYKDQSYLLGTLIKNGLIEKMQDRLKIMTRSIDDYFAFNHAALTVKNQRLELISGNIANASTPGFKAKDLDFAGLLRKSFDPIATATDMPISITNTRHMGYFSGPAWSDTESGVTYYVPLAPSLDNNTVEIGVEQARYGRAVADYQASLQFAEDKIAGLRKAFKGE